MRLLKLRAPTMPPERPSLVAPVRPPSHRPLRHLPPSRSPRRPDREASASARRQGRVAMARAASHRPTVPRLIPRPFRRLRLLKLRAPTMPPERPSLVARPSSRSLVPPSATAPAAFPIPAPPGPRSFSERASPRPRRHGQGRVPPSHRPSSHSPPIPPLALAEASRSDHAAGASVPRRPSLVPFPRPTVRYGTCRLPDPRAARTAKLQRARVSKAASPWPRPRPTVPPSLVSFPAHSAACAC
jgi:hypothetical protein